MIECYYITCPKHCFWHDPETGPFCDQYKCTATEDERKEYARVRAEEMKS